MIFNMVCERATPKQWAEWLRVPLEHAAGTANADLVDKLLKAGADGSAGWKGCEGKTLLHAAAEGGNERVMSTLMRAGAKNDINTKALANGRTPLHVAAQRGKVAAAKVLMMAGADVNVLDAHDNVPLHLAIVEDHPGVAENLLLRGADPDVECGGGDCPIHHAAYNGQDEIARNLLHAGAQVDRLDKEGWTALGLAVMQNHLSTVKVLLDGGADSAVFSNSDGQTPLHIAVQEQNADMVAALVEAGADIEARNSRGLTPLHWSALIDSRAAMLALLQLGAEVHEKSARGKSTPLHYACQNGHLDAADLLLRRGADETALDKNGKTPGARIKNISRAAEEDRPRLERLSRLLASAPQDRAWRRRGMLVMCHAHPDRLRLVVKIPDTAEASEQPQGRPTRRSRRSQVKVEVAVGGERSAGGGGAGSSVGGGGGRRASREGSGGGGGGGFDGVAAWLMALTEEDVFRKVVGFL